MTGEGDLETKMKKRHQILFILSRIYGGKTITSRIVEVVNELKYIEPTYLFFDYSDYCKYAIPKMLRFSPIEANIIIKKKYNDAIKNKFDILFFQSESLILGFYGVIKKYPTALALDNTPTLSQQILLNYEPNNGFKKAMQRIKIKIEISLFRRGISNIDFFLPRTNWVANDLKMNYGISENRMEVTYCPHNLSLWKPKKRRENNKFVLLFVGNDFHGGKGGDFLLSLYKRFLSKHCILKILSNDYDLNGGILEEGIEIIKGITHENLNKLIEIYNSADLFIFPTRYDKLGIVITEAASMGLPIIARDIGGIKEIVKNDYNGYLMPYKSDISEWAQKILFLIENPQILKRFSNNSRRIAEDILSMEKFSNKIKNTIDYLIKLIPYYEGKRIKKK